MDVKNVPIAVGRNVHKEFAMQKDDIIFSSVCDELARRWDKIEVRDGRTKYFVDKYWMHFEYDTLYKANTVYMQK